MRTLSRHMAGAFGRPFLFSVLLFSLLIFLGHVFDRLTVLLRSEAPITTILWYLALQVPYWTVRIIPIATLLATLLCLSDLIRSGEWIGILAAGYRPAQVLAPLLGCVAGVGLLTLVAQETVFPYCYREAKRVYEEGIQRRPPQRRWKDVVLLSRPGEFLMARVFDAEQGEMYKVVLDTYGLARTQLNALEGRWTGERWVFYNGVRRSFEPGELLAKFEEPFVRYPSDLRLPPEELAPRTKEPDEMSMAETLKHIARLRRIGASTHRAEVAFHAKIAHPFSNVVIFALGIPFALRMRRANRALCFAGALAIGFGYWWGLSMGQMMGEAGRLPPWAGAWAGNILFGVAAAAGLKWGVSS